MPWQKNFDTTEALEAATRLFWEKGYEAAPFPDIVAVTKASRYGLYEVFGDKRGLFLKALDHYQKTIIGALTSELQEETASLPAIRAYFDRLVAFTNCPEICYGCLMVTAVTEG